MAFQSILFEGTQNGAKKETAEMPDFFPNLNLDQIIDAIAVQKREYDLKPFFYTSLSDIGTIEYRQEVMQELEDERLFKYVKSFANGMHVMREDIIQSKKLYYQYQKERWFLDAVELYCDSVISLANHLSHLDLKSRGFLDLRKYLEGYIVSERFKSLFDQTKKLKTDLSTIKYSVFIKDNKVKVQKYESEIDYSEEIQKTFEKFKQESVKDYRIKLLETMSMNHVEAKILELVAKLYPDIFLNLDTYYAQNRNYMNKTISNFDREIQFYISYFEYTAILKRTGLKFCYPKVSNASKEVYDYEGFDLALAHKLVIDEGSAVVCNDFYLKDKERIFVVTGPNQGGKTTFARTFGQLHYLSLIGLPVPGREAQLFLFDKIFTHFEREENIGNLRGKLEDDLVRVRNILNQATPNSIIIMNEIFSSTTLKDALFLSKKVMEKMIELDSFVTLVTFMDELSSLSEKVVSMVSTVEPENPALRTYKILRKPADGLSYAISIAKKYRLTYDYLKERIKQ